MKKNRKRLSVMRLEERVLFDAAAVAAAAEAAQQEQENQDLQQQQQQLQEQLAQEAAQQQLQQAAGVDSQTPGAEPDTGTDTGDDAPAADDAASAQGGEAAQGDSAGSEVADAVESITADDGVEGSDLADLPGSDAGDDVVGDTLEGLNQDQTDAQEPAAAADTGTDADSDTDAAGAAAAYAPDAEETPEAAERHELAVISNTVPDSKLIIDSLEEGTEVLVLNDDSDVLDQINEYLDASAVKYDAIHIVSHGGSGHMVLNGTRIDMQSLEADPASWAAIGEHLTNDGDILLYGCNIAADEDGRAFASQLASLTGADVAASAGPTGQYGWELEYMTGSVAAPIITVTGYDADFGSYTAVVVGQGQYVDTETVHYRLSGGQLQTQTKTETVWSAWTDVPNTGSLQWCIDQANSDFGSSVITSGMTTVKLSFGNVTISPSDSLTISLGDDSVGVSNNLNLDQSFSLSASTIRLNNHTITVEGSTTASFTSSDAAGGITGVGNITVDDATLTLSASSGSVSLNNSDITVNNEGTVSITGGSGGVSGVHDISVTGTVTINGGKGGIGSVGDVNLSKGTLTLNGLLGDVGDVTSAEGSKLTVTDGNTGTVTSPRNYGTLSITDDFTFSDNRWASFDSVSMGNITGGTSATWNVGSSNVTIKGVGTQNLAEDSISSTGIFEYKVNNAHLWGGSYRTLVLSGSGNKAQSAYSYSVGMAMADAGAAGYESFKPISASQVNDDGIVYRTSDASHGHINLTLYMPITGATFGQTTEFTDGRDPKQVDSQGLNVTFAEWSNDPKPNATINPGNYHDLTITGTVSSDPKFERIIANNNPSSEDPDVRVAGTFTVEESVRYLRVRGELSTYMVKDTANTVWDVTGKWNFQRLYDDIGKGPYAVGWTHLRTNPDTHLTGTDDGYYKGGHSEENPVPGFTVAGKILNSGEMYFNQLGYRFMDVENKGTITTDTMLDPAETAAGAAGRWISFAHLENKSDGILTFQAPARIEEMMTSNGGWTNYGAMRVLNYNYFGYDADTALTVTNYTGASMYFSNNTLEGFTHPYFVDYVFDNRDSGRAPGVQQVSLINGGSITAGPGSRLIFVGFDELDGAREKASYRVSSSDDGLHFAGAMYFEMAEPLATGIYGDITVTGGTVNFNTAGQVYRGSVTVSSVTVTGRPTEYGTININQRSIFGGAFESSDQYSIVNVGTEGVSAVDETHRNGAWDGNTSAANDGNTARPDLAVINRYYFSDDNRSQIVWHNNNVRTLSGEDWRDFNLGLSWIGPGIGPDSAPWRGTLLAPRAAQFSDANGTTFNGSVTTLGTFTVNADEVTFEGPLSITHDFLIAGNDTEFKGAVTLNRGTVRNTVLTYADENVTGTIFKGSVTVNGANGYTSLFLINAVTEFQSSLSNSGGGVVVSSDGNIFNTIANSGSNAEFYMNSTGNTLNQQVSNSGGATFTLNNVNTFKNFNNSANLIINQEASQGGARSKFETLTNSGTATFRGAFDIDNNYQNSGTTLQQWGDIDYKGGITNSGSFLLTNTGDEFYDGRYIFNSEITNTGNFKLSSALAEFKKTVTNSGTFLVSSDLDTRYTSITDTKANIFAGFKNQSNGTLTIDSGAATIGGTGSNLFNGEITNAGNITVNKINEFASKVTNTGTWQINAALDFARFDNSGSGKVYLNADSTGTAFDLLNNDANLYISASGNGATPSVSITFDANQLYNTANGTIIVGYQNAPNVYVEFGANSGANFENHGTIEFRNPENGFTAPLVNYGTLKFVTGESSVAQQTLQAGTTIVNQRTILIDTNLEILGTVTNTANGAITIGQNLPRTLFSC